MPFEANEDRELAQYARAELGKLVVSGELPQFLPLSDLSNWIKSEIAFWGVKGDAYPLSGILRSAQQYALKLQAAQRNLEVSDSDDKASNAADVVGMDSVAQVKSELRQVVMNLARKQDGIFGAFQHSYWAYISADNRESAEVCTSLSSLPQRHLRKRSG